MTLYPLLFEPNLHTVVWGGDRLCPYKGLKPQDTPIGESWEVSAVPSSTSIVSNGEWAGKELTTVIDAHPKEILGESVNKLYDGKMPLLVKLIDAKGDLSIQVHPNDEMAKRVHGKSGKTEMWYVIDANPGSYLYAGFKSKISEYEYKKRIADGTITDVLARHEASAGVLIGGLHATDGLHHRPDLAVMLDLPEILGHQVLIRVGPQLPDQRRFHGQRLAQLVLDGNCVGLYYLHNTGPHCTQSQNCDLDHRCSSLIRTGSRI